MADTTYSSGEVDRAGSRSALARRWRCHGSVVDDAANEDRFTPTVLRHLRLEAVVVYHARVRPAGRR